MSLKTTNKEARAAVRQYILDHFTLAGMSFPGLALLKMWLVSSLILTW